MAGTQTISDRARAKPEPTVDVSEAQDVPAVAIGVATPEMPEGQRPLSEQFRVVAKRWATADAAAYLMHESKASVLSQMTLAIYDTPATDKRPAVAVAEMRARASDDWHKYLQDMGNAKREANLLKVQLDYIRMQERDLDRGYWNQRIENKLGRSGT